MHHASTDAEILSLVLASCSDCVVQSTAQEPDIQTHFAVGQRLTELWIGNAVSLGSRPGGNIIALQEVVEDQNSVLLEALGAALALVPPAKGHGIPH